MSNWFDNIRIYHLLIDRFNGGWQVPPKSENVFTHLQVGKLSWVSHPEFRGCRSTHRHVGRLSVVARQGPRQRNEDYLRLCAQPLLV